MSETSGVFGKPQFFLLLFLMGAIFYGVIQFSLAPTFFDSLWLVGNDDAMRLAVVRDFMAGQGWYDMIQYRVMPPDGLSLHWSRMVDLAIAGLIAPLRFLFGDPMAERLAVAIWPAGLFLLFLLITGRSAQAGFGNSAASFAMMMTGLMQMVNGSVFRLGRIDHHNVQVLCVALILALMLRGGTARSAVLIGVVAAFSMAIGMESIAVLGLTGIILTVAFVLDRPMATARLAGFGMGLGLAAPVFFAIQTAPADWGEIHCDALSVPYLVLTTGAGLLGLAAALLRFRFAGPMGRVSLVVLVAAGMIAVFAPELRVCAGGPYAAVPDIVKEKVISITPESLPALEMFRTKADFSLALFFPFVFAAFFSAIFWRIDKPNRRSWRLVLVYLLLALAGSFIQTRALNWALAVLPVAVGAVLAELARRPWLSIGWIRGISVAAMAIVVFMPQLLAPLLPDDLRGADGKPKNFHKPDLRACIHEDVLSTLNAIPPAFIMTPTNLGPPMLVYSHHSVTSAPYHRNADAMLTGIMAFWEDEAELARRAKLYGVEMVIVCADKTYRTKESIGTQLAEGDAPDWLVPVEGVNAKLRLYRVDRKMADDG